MPRTLSTLLAPALAALLAGGLYIQMGAYRKEDDKSAFHLAVREAVDQIPMRIADFDSVEKPAPPAAGKLLRPNAMFSRLYRSPSGRWVTLIFIHCRDSRDMSGHYPPNCYPGNGWTQKGPVSEKTFTLWGRHVPIAEYQFTRAEFDRSVTWNIYDLFVLPAGGFVTSMRDVQAASGDYRSRPYGAAQIQLIFDAGTPESERLELLKTMLEPLRPVIDRLQVKKEGASS